MSHVVFLSHSGADAAKAEKLCSALEAAGIKCWIAPRDIPGGASYSGEIVRAIAGARLMVLLYSSHAAQSRHVRSELEVAFNDGDSILAIRLENHAMPPDVQYFLSTGQWIDAYQRDFAQDLDRIVKSVEAAVKGAPVPQPTQPPHRRKILAYAGAFLVLILAAAVWRTSGTLTKETAAPSPSATPPSTPPPSENKSVAVPARETNAAPASLSEKINAKDNQKYVLISPGRYLMGCSAADSECEEDEKPSHWVNIKKPFWLGQFEVTVRAFRNYAKTTGRKISGADDQLPVTAVDRAEAVAFCRWAGGRLPSEAEWEYAARGGQSEPRYGPLLDIAWIDRNSGDAAHPVGQKQPNAYGLHDMLGNVSEWVLDRYYNKYYEEEAGSAPEEPVAGNATAISRGGSWAFGASSARASNRAEMEKDSTEPFLGFRCVLN